MLNIGARQSMLNARQLVESGGGGQCVTRCVP